MKNNILKIGQNKITEIVSTLHEANISGKILYVCDSYVDQLYGNIVKPQLEKVGLLKIEIVSNNTIEYAMNVAERVIATDIDCIVAMGGGKTLDVAKYAAFISKCPFLSIPTTVAHDGIVSPIAVLKRKDNKPKSLGCAMPSMIILDTKLVATCPTQLIKAGIGDTISNYMALKDWEFAVSKGKDVMNGFAYLMSKNSLDALMKSQFDCICPEFIDVLANSLVLSGIAMDFAGSSRPVSGSEHLFSHALDYYCEKQNLHGFNVALGTISVLKLLGFNYFEVLDYLKKFEVDINPQNMGIDIDMFVLCMQKATTMRSNRYTHLHEADLCDSNLRRIYTELLGEL